MIMINIPEDALKALAQDESEEMLNPHLLFDRFLEKFIFIIHHL